MRDDLNKHFADAEAMRTGTKRVVVVGAGGHASVLVDIVEGMPDMEITGFISMNENETLYHYPCLGGNDALPRIFQSGVTSALLAVGDNRRRKSLMDLLNRFGFNLVNAISPAAWISKYAEIGMGVAVLPGAIVNANTRLGDAVIVNTNASVDHDCTLGKCVHVAPGSNIAAGVKLGDGAFLGTGSSVIPGISIGAWTLVGAGAVVISDLPAGVVAVGVPAAVSKAME